MAWETCCTFAQRSCWMVLVLCAAWTANASADEPPSSEVIRERYPNGAVRVERHVIQIENGDYVNHGPYTYFGPDGRKLGGGEFVLGKRNGVWTRWFYRADGPLFQEPVYAPYDEPFLSEAHFVDGQIHGPWSIYDRHKQKISEWHFEAGKPHGVWTWYYPGGQKRRELIYVQGDPEGKVLQWSRTGVVDDTEQYAGGRLRRLESAYYGPRQKRWEGWYLYGKEITKTTYDWWKGQASTIVLSVAGEKVRDGKWTWWYPNGQKESEGVYVAGAKNGVWTWWHPNGQKWIQGEYVLDSQSGRWTWWNPEGKVERTKEFPTITAPPSGDPDATELPLVDANAPPVTVDNSLAPPVTSEAPPVDAAEPAPATIPTPDTDPPPAPASVPAPAPAPESDPAPAPVPAPAPAPAPAPEAPPAPSDVEEAPPASPAEVDEDEAALQASEL